MPKKLLIIDTFNFLHRAYHALPTTLTDSEGNPTNAVYGVAAMLVSVFDTLKPDYAVAALDSKEPTFRVADFTAYKAHRRPMEDALAEQIPKVFEIISAFGVNMLTVNGYEADDIIGTFVNKLKKDDIEIIIASNDRDLWQLVSDKVYIMTPSTKGAVEWLGKKEVEARLGFDADHLIDFKGLKGDPSDNIPGVFGVGEKTAKELIAKYGTVEEIYRRVDEIEPTSLRERLLNNYEQALMSKKLATVVHDVPVEVDLNKCKYSAFNKGRVRDVFERYRFKSLIRRLGFDGGDGRRAGRKGVRGGRDSNGDNGTAALENVNQVSLF